MFALGGWWGAVATIQVSLRFEACSSDDGVVESGCVAIVWPNEGVEYLFCNPFVTRATIESAGSPSNPLFSLVSPTGFEPVTY